MAFEIAHPQHHFEGLSPLRRMIAVFLGVALLAGLAWCCSVAYHARPDDAPAPPQRTLTPSAEPRAT
jgi:hypothetical protein